MKFRIGIRLDPTSNPLVEERPLLFDRRHPAKPLQFKDSLLQVCQRKLAACHRNAAAGSIGLSLVWSAMAASLL